MNLHFGPHVAFTCDCHKKLRLILYTTSTNCLQYKGGWKFKILLALLNTIQIFRDVRPRTLVNNDRRFEEP
jgi:hypothetical protein